MKSSFVAVLTRAAIARWADDGALERGKEYFVSGCVVDLAEVEDVIVALVSGTHLYNVRLWPADAGGVRRTGCHAQRAGS